MFSFFGKTWRTSQRYELEHAIGFMQEPFFRDLFARWRAGSLNLSTGHCDELTLTEFFGGSRADFDKFVSHIRGKACLDIGPCVMSPLSTWDVAGERFAIEPLLKPIEDWQKKNLGASCYQGMRGFAAPAESVVPSLVGKIDGAILCRNMLDHTPRWKQVLQNIGAYAAPGCKLLLWTDLHHRGEEDEGHYNISDDPASFKQSIKALGFDVIREYSAAGRHELNWGCFAEKR